MGGLRHDVNSATGCVPRLMLAGSVFVEPRQEVKHLRRPYGDHVFDRESDDVPVR